MLSEKIRAGEIKISDLVGSDIKKKHKVLSIKPSKNMLKDLPELPGNKSAYSNFDIIHFLNEETNYTKEEIADYIALTEKNFPEIFK